MVLVTNLEMIEHSEAREPVEASLRRVMAHAVAGHDQTEPGSGFSHTYCNDAAHALEILLESGVASFVLDSTDGDVIPF